MTEKETAAGVDGAGEGKPIETTRHITTTRLIEVELEGWSLDCCGQPFGVGDEVTWTLAALPPRPAAPARYLEERHASSLPVREVTGVVLSLTGLLVTGRQPVVGEGVQMPDRSERVVRRFDRFDRTRGGWTLRAALEISADTELPPPWTPSPPAVRDVPRPPADVVTGLHALLRTLHSEYGDRVRIRSMRGGAKASLLPAATGAGAVHWATGPELIVLNLEYTRVLLPADESGVQGLEALVRELAGGTPPAASEQPSGTDRRQGGPVLFGRRRSVPTSAW